MSRPDLPALAIFAAIVDAGGFRAAARRLGLSVSALSQSLKQLEEGLGTRLLHRSTRSVAPTEAGTRLLQRLTPALGEIEQALAELHDHSAQPAGWLRLNVPRSAARLALAPILADFLAAYPAIRLDLHTEDGFVDIVAAGCDAGIRLREAIAGDMIAHAIGPRRLHLAVGGAPDYLARRGRPQHPADLANHACLGQRFADGRLFEWEFARGDTLWRHCPAGPLVTNDPAQLIIAAQHGVGLVMSFAQDIAAAGLEPVLEEWCPPFDGFQIYYSGRRHPPPPLRALVEFLRLRP